MIQRFLAEKCGCIFVALITQGKGERYCNVAESRECFDNFINRSEKNQFLAQCPSECDIIDYDTSISTLSATSLDYLKEYVEYNYEGQFSRILNLSSSAYLINIYFNELGYTQIVEVPNYTPISLISNIGGTLGLFLGMSLLSFIEIVDLVIQMILTSTRSNSNQVENY
jgi:hypothetical protein